MIPEELSDKVPPHNSEAEQAVLGAILIDPDSVPVILKYLRPEDFYDNANREIFAGVISLYERNQKVDLITLTDELKSLGTLDAARGPAYLAGLSSVTPSAANVEYYARIVQEASVRRSLIKLSSEITKKAHDESITSGETLDEAQARIFEITENRQSVGYKSIKDLLHDTVVTIEALYKNNNAFTGIPSGLDELDSMTSGFQNSELIIIGARPSVGKTALALTMASNVAIRAHIPCAFLSLEMSDMAIMQRLVAGEARVPGNRIRAGTIKQQDFQAIVDAASRIYEAPLYIVDAPNMKLLDLRTIIRRLKAERGVKIVFIDYLTLITHENAELARWEQISDISRSLKALARELKIPIVALSQLKREAEGKLPTLADLRESGSIEQDADVILFLHRDRESEKTTDQQSPIIETQLIMAKQRNGPVGTIKIGFLPAYTRFENLEKHKD